MRPPPGTKGVLGSLLEGCSLDPVLKMDLGVSQEDGSGSLSTSHSFTTGTDASNSAGYTCTGTDLGGRMTLSPAVKNSEKNINNYNTK